MAAPSILVVDDQPINVQLLKRKLEREGIRVIAAYNGLEALDTVKKEKPDLILLDVMMPDMDGIEVCQRLQANEETHGIPVIFITARTTKESKLEGLGVGAVDYITKPIDLDETLARHPPPAVSGKRIKLRYVTQPKARPPSFVLFGTRTSELPESYVRYLVNGLRETFDLPGTPIRLAFRTAENPYAKK